MQDLQQPEEGSPGPTRRGTLECMVWAGTGLLWSLGGGLPRAIGLERAVAGETAPAPFTFLQISDSHVGFSKPANPDALGTLREAVGKIAKLREKPAFILHTGDISHLSKEQEFDDADQILREIGVPIVFVPGEHDLLDEGQGRAYLRRYGKGSRGAGWTSFDRNGVHFIGLVNVVDLKAGGLGNLGTEQLGWLERDVAGLSSSTPIVVFAHIPLWTVYPEWGWGTQDGGRALALLGRFGSVTVLNGHIHQIIQKVEGNVAFHTARSTAFPQPAPGSAPSPGPMKVPAGELRGLLGVTSVSLVRGTGPLAIVDIPLGG
ncbi:metallophosphoesterase family protein [Methylobacterium sp. P5_C11]